MAKAIAKCNRGLKSEEPPGTDDEIDDYKLYLTAFFAVRLVLDDEVRDVEMAPNVSKYGAFGDLVIKVYYESRDTILYLLQLKHEKNPEKPVDFNKTNAECILEMSKDSYHKDIRKRISEGERDVLLKGVELLHIVPCLFTNAVFPEDIHNIALDKRASLSCEARIVSYKWHDVINTINTISRQYYYFQMHPKQSNFTQFLSSYLFTGDQKEYEEAIKKIEEKFPKSEVHKIKKIGNCFRDILKIKIEDEMNFDSILSSVTKPLKELFNKEVESDLLDEILSKISDCCRLEYQFAQKVYSFKCAEYFKFFQRFRFYDGQLNCEEVIGAITSRIESSLGKCNDEVVKKFLAYIQEYFKLDRLLVKQQIQRKLLELMLAPLSLSDEDFEKRFEIFQRVTDLNDPTQKWIVSQHVKVALQGRKKTGLWDIVDSNFCRALKPEFLLNHMGGVVHVGKILELKCENYIKRTFAKVFVMHDIFQVILGRYVFIVSVSKRSKVLRNIQNQGRFIIDLRYKKKLPNEFPSVENNYVILILNEGDVDGRAKTLMKSIVIETNTVLLYLNEIDGLLEWKGSRNMKRNLYRGDGFSSYNFGTEDKCVQEEELLQYFENAAVNFISAESGTGKSTVLDSLIRYCPSDKWALKLSLNECVDDFHDKLEEILEDPLQYIYEKFERDYCKDEFSKQIFNYMKNKNAVIVFIDFDSTYNILIPLVKIIHKIERLEVHTWVFSHTNLELYMDTPAIRILPLRKGEIKDCLLKSIKINKPSLEPFLQKITDSVKIPLHLNMFSSILCNELNWDDFQVTDLYENFITSKCDIYCKKIEINQKINCVVDEIVSVDSEVRNSIPVFYHRNFAEYLTAKWFASNTNKYLGYSRRLRFDSENVTFFFDKIFTREHPLHAAIVDGDLELVRTLCNKSGLVLCDSLNRTPLHLVTNLFKFRDHFDDGIYINEVACKIMNEICENFANAKVFVRQKDYWGRHWNSDGVELLQKLLLIGCYWGCKAVVIMCLVNDLRYSDFKNAFEFAIRGGHTDCLKLLVLCDAHYDIERIKKLTITYSQPLMLELLNDMTTKPDISEYLWKNFESEVVYVLKFLIANEKLFIDEGPSFRFKGYIPEGFKNLLERFKEQVFNKYLEDTTKKLNRLEKLEKRFKLLGIKEELNVFERMEAIRKMQLSGCTPLCAAAFIGNLNAVKVIANRSGNINANPGDKIIPLHCAIEEGNFEVIKWLIEAGANVNQVDCDGNTPLAYCSKIYDEMQSRERWRDIFNLLTLKGAAK